MSMLKPRKLSTITIIYWFLLCYIVAALIFWFFELEQHNEKMTGLLLNELRHDEPNYYDKVSGILDEKKRKTAQYIGEGSIFLALILFGAVYVYRTIRKRLQLSAQQQNFMMAVTHELKTPIAVARLNLETLQKRRLEELQQQKLIDITLQEVNRLNSLCNNILLASQLDAGEYKISKNEVNVSELTRRVVADFAARHPTRELRLSAQERLTVTGEELLLEMLMTNLVENALKYSQKSAPVDVALNESREGIQFVVKDKGPGIAEIEGGKIFEKFYRVGNEATRTAKGTGLGLYLCRKIAADHNAIISVTDNDDAGSVFTVSFRGTKSRS